MRDWAANGRSARAWSSPTGLLADPLKAMPKYVLSRTLIDADNWANTTVVRYDAQLHPDSLPTRREWTQSACDRAGHEPGAARNPRRNAHGRP